jgi:putative transposase
MPRREVKLCAGGYYHLYNRGHNRGRIFFARENYMFFLRRLCEYVLPVLDVVAYCLMPTHYHLLVWVKTVKTSEKPRKSPGR